MNCFLGVNMSLCCVVFSSMQAKWFSWLAAQLGIVHDLHFLCFACLLHNVALHWKVDRRLDEVGTPLVIVDSVAVFGRFFGSDPFPWWAHGGGGFTSMSGL